MKFKRKIAFNISDEIKSLYDGVYSSGVDNLKIVSKDGLWGVIDESGNIVVPVIYTELSNFKKWGDQNLAVAEKENVSGLIDSQNNIVIPIEYTNFNYNRGNYIGINDNNFYIFSPVLKINKKFETSDFDYLNYFPSNLTPTKVQFNIMAGVKIFILEFDGLKVYLIVDNTDLVVLEINREAFESFVNILPEKINDTKSSLKQDLSTRTPFEIKDIYLNKFFEINFLDDTFRLYCVIKDKKLCPLFGGVAVTKKFFNNQVYTVFKIMDSPITLGLADADGNIILSPVYHKIEGGELDSVINLFKWSGGSEGPTIEKYDLKNKEFVNKESENTIESEITEYNVDKIIPSIPNSESFFIVGEDNVKKKYQIIEKVIKNEKTTFWAFSSEEKRIDLYNIYFRPIKTLSFEQLINIGSIQTMPLDSIYQVFVSSAGPMDKYKWFFRNTDSVFFICDSYFYMSAQEARESILSSSEPKKCQGSSLVVQNDKCGVIDSNFNIKVPLEYDRLAFISSDNVKNYLIAKRFGKYGIITLDNRLILPFIYEYIEFSKDFFNVEINSRNIKKIKTESQLLKLSQALINQVINLPDYLDEISESEKDNWLAFHQQKELQNRESTIEYQNQEKLDKEAEIDRKKVELYNILLGASLYKSNKQDNSAINFESLVTPGAKKQKGKKRIEGLVQELLNLPQSDLRFLVPVVNRLRPEIPNKPGLDNLEKPSTNTTLLMDIGRLANEIMTLDEQKKFKKLKTKLIKNYVSPQSLEEASDTDRLEDETEYPVAEEPPYDSNPDQEEIEEINEGEQEEINEGDQGEQTEGLRGGGPREGLRRWRARVVNPVTFGNSRLDPGTETSSTIFAVDEQDALRQVLEVCPGSSPEDFAVEEIFE